MWPSPRTRLALLLLLLLTLKQPTISSASIFPISFSPSSSGNGIIIVVVVVIILVIGVVDGRMSGCLPQDRPPAIATSSRTTLILSLPLPLPLAPRGLGGSLSHLGYLGELRSSHSSSCQMPIKPPSLSVNIPRSVDDLQRFAELVRAVMCLLVLAPVIIIQPRRARER